MDPQEWHSWTLSGLVVAFLELALAYCLLCGSAFMFLASKFILVFGLYLPCPCTGILWYQNGDICLHKLLFDWPLRKIYTIHNLARDRLPFDVVWRQERERNCSSTMLSSDGKHENDSLKPGYLMGSSSVLDSRMKNLAEKDSDAEVKGKRSMNRKQKVTFRLRRGKSSPVFLNSNVQSVFTGFAGSSDIPQVVKVEISENPVDDVTQNELNLEDTTSFCGDSVLDGERTNETMEGSSSSKSLIHGDMDTIKTLEQALREERAARMALTLELEKERAAAATAADEAMAMILRLQADKASLKMESKQYERMIEEKFAYDEEEMNILKEILVRREKENHFLEKELEAYKQIDVSDNELQEHGFDKNNDYGETPTAQIDFSVEKNLSFCNSETEKNEADVVKTNIREYCSSPDRETIVYDVHVIEDETELHREAKMGCTEIEWLGERLRNLLKLKERLVNSVEHNERVSAHMKLMEEMVNLLQEIKQMNEPVNQ